MAITDINAKPGMISCNLPVNLSEKQRTISTIAGGVLLALGIFDFSKSGFRRAIRMTLGTLMVMRGTSGYCPMTAMMEKKAAEAAEQLPVAE